MAMFGADADNKNKQQRAERHDCKQFGTLISPCGNFTEPCLVLNQSRTGALVEVELQTMSVMI